jgi:hypothetical protein
MQPVVRAQLDSAYRRIRAWSCDSAIATAGVQVLLSPLGAQVQLGRAAKHGVQEKLMTRRLSLA